MCKTSDKCKAIILKLIKNDLKLPEDLRWKQIQYMHDIIGTLIKVKVKIFFLYIFFWIFTYFFLFFLMIFFDNFFLNFLFFIYNFFSN